MNSEKAIAYLAKVAERRAVQAAKRMERQKAETLERREFIKAQRKKHMPRWTIHRDFAGMYVVCDERRVGVARFHAKTAARRFIKLSGAINTQPNLCTK